jgi:hypothetical protein
MAKMRLCQMQEEEQHAQEGGMKNDMPHAPFVKVYNRHGCHQADKRPRHHRSQQLRLVSFYETYHSENNFERERGGHHAVMRSAGGGGGRER